MIATYVITAAFCLLVLLGDYIAEWHLAVMWWKLTWH